MSDSAWPPASTSLSSPQMKDGSAGPRFSPRGDGAATAPPGIRDSSLGRQAAPPSWHDASGSHHIPALTLPGSLEDCSLAWRFWVHPACRAKASRGPSDLGQGLCSLGTHVPVSTLYRIQSLSTLSPLPQSLPTWSHLGSWGAGALGAGELESWGAGGVGELGDWGAGKLGSWGANPMLPARLDSLSLPWQLGLSPQSLCLCAGWQTHLQKASVMNHNRHCGQPDK